MLPCLQEKNLSLFSATADQRYQLGKETFLRTHFPVRMKRYFANSTANNYNEQELLQDLLHGDVSKNNVKGNRTYVLYGAAGTGKSEIMRWLYCHLSDTKIGPYTLRISRTELDPVQILHKILTQFTQKGLDHSILHSWEEMKSKPVTLANRLIWSALGEMFASDEEIIPLSYRMRPIVEKNLRQAFTTMDNFSENNTVPPELISLEDLHQMTQQCSLPINIDCEKLHFQMGRELEVVALGGMNFVGTLKRISLDIYESVGIRPVLLIDDLVQSLNVYATDLLDYFITMEEGNWDVILGLTPASFEATLRGREILERIQYLDTFGDRLTKLWVSDEQGFNSYVVTLKNCHLFAKKYLMEYKNKAGFKCGIECPFATRCLAFQNDKESLLLLPFNVPLLKRIYRSLPEGKGKPRYFILALGDMMRKMAQKDWSGALGHQLDKELAADHPDTLLRIFAESYAPEITETACIEFNGQGVNWLLGEKICSDDTLKIKMTVLTSREEQGQQEDLLLGRDSNIDPGKAAIKDWLNHQTVNKELLKGLRLGVAHLLRELVQPNSLMRPYISRQAPLLKFDKSMEGSKIPLVLENVDSFPGIVISTSLGHTAYYFHYLHLRRGERKEEALETIMNSKEVSRLVLKATELKNKWKEQLEEEVGIPLEELAYLLIVLLMELGEEGSILPPAFSSNEGQLKRYPREIRHLQVFLDDVIAQKLVSFFKDWFQLRDNLIDGYRLMYYHKKHQKTDIFRLLQAIDCEKINEVFKIGTIPLGQFIAAVLGVVNKVEIVLRDEKIKNLLEKSEHLLKMLLEIQHPGAHNDMSIYLAQIAQGLKMDLPAIPDWQHCNKLFVKIKRTCKKFLTKDWHLYFESAQEIHQYLCILGNLEDNSIIYKQLWSLIEFIFDAEEKKRQETKVLANKLGLGKSYMPTLPNEADIDKLADDSFLHSLGYLAYTSQEIANAAQKIKILEAAYYYIDEELEVQVVNVKKNLDKLSADSPRWFNERVEEIKDICGKYLQSLNYLKHNNLDPGSSSHVVSTLSRMYQKLSNGNLKKELLILYRAWEDNLQQLQTLLMSIGVFNSNNMLTQQRALGGDIRQEVLESLTLEELSSQFTEFVAGTLNSFRQLRDIAWIDERFMWIIEAIINRQDSGIPLEVKKTQELTEFLNEYQSIGGNLLMKIILK